MEGFCVPIVESMLMKLPVIAFKSTAVPYTMNNTGVLVDKKDHQKIAQIIGIIIHNNRLKEKIITAQYNHASKFSNYELFKESFSQLINTIKNGRS